MTGIYIFLKYLTAPGALVRGMWEQIVCRASKIVVEDNRYLRQDESSSHIEHELAETSRSAFAMCFVPFFFNMLGAFIFGLIPTIMLIYLQFKGLFLGISCAISYWFAFSLFCNAFPLVEDAMNMMDKVYHHGTIIQKIFYAPGAVITYAGAYLEKYAITFIVAIIFTIAVAI